jgi:hypothetical protein
MQRISKSVGKGGKNEPADVKIVQELLNKFARIGEYSKVDVSGQVDDKTLSAIAAFQEKVVGMRRADKLVEPGKNTIKKLNENASAVAKEAKANENGAAGGGKGKGKVTGKYQGVDKSILDLLEAVADHYGKEIYVTSGLRTKEKQAEVMWDYWTRSLKRGMIYEVLKSNATLRKQLDDWWKTGNEEKNASSAAKKEAETSFKREIAKIATSLSRHTRGLAVDIDTNVDKNVFEVLKMYMKFVHETNMEGQTSCYHFDNRKGTIPRVTDALKAKWPAAK